MVYIAYAATLPVLQHDWHLSGTAAGMMNTGSALAAILSPIAFGYIIDATGNWQLPFAGSLGFLLLGALLAPTMHPERAFESEPRVVA